MSAVWTASGATSSAAGYSEAELQDGTLIFAYELTNTNYALAYATDRSTFHNIFTWTGTANHMPYVGVDSFGNIFLCITDTAIGTGSNGVQGQAFVKGSGYSWTAKGWMNAGNPGTVTFGTGANPFVWCNTGGGTNAAGHLVMGVRYFPGGVYEDGVMTVDAGALLAGSGTPFVAATNWGFGGSSSGASPSISADGFGASNGLILFAGTPSSGLFSWTVSPSGVATSGTLIPQPSTFYITSSAAQYPLLRVAPGVWVLVYASTNAINTMQAIAYSSTAAITTPALSPLVYIGPWWVIAAASAITSNRVWVYVFDPSVAKQLNRIAINLVGSTLVWDAAPVIEDTSFGTASAPVNQAIVHFGFVQQPVGPVIDFLVTTYDGSTYTLNGGVSQPELSLNAPALVAPVNSAYVDATVTIPVAWVYNTGDGATQAAYALRVRVAGSVGYRYWNAAGGVLSSTIVWNPLTTGAFTLPANVLTNNRIYQWSLATKSNEAAVSSFPSDQILYASAVPVGTSLTIPSAVSTGFVAGNAFGPIVWTVAMSSFSKQVTYRVVVYTGTQTITSGFTPGVSPGYYDSGVLVGTATSLTLPGAYPLTTNGFDNWYVYMQVTTSGGQTSAWFTSFGATYGGANPVVVNGPLLTAVAGTDPGTGAPRVTLNFDGNQNMLPANDTSFETGVGTWVNNANAVLTSSTTVAKVGTHSLRMAGIAAGSMSAVNTPVAIQPNIPYVINGYAYPFAALRTASINYTVQNASHVTQTTGGAGAAEVGGVWTPVTITSSSGIAAAAFLLLQLGISSMGGAGELHYWDWVTLTPAGTLASFYYSDDQVNWYPVRGAQNISIPALTTAGQPLVVYDYEAPPGKTRYYQAYSSVTVNGNVLTSPWSTLTSAVTAPGVSWWLKDPIDTTVALAFNQGSQNVQTHLVEKVAQYELLGRAHPVSVSDGMTGEPGTANINTDDDAHYQIMLKLLTRPGRVLLLQSPFGYQWYVNLTQSRDISLPAWFLGKGPIRTTQISYVQADMP